MELDNITLSEVTQIQRHTQLLLDCFLLVELNAMTYFSFAQIQVRKHLSFYSTIFTQKVFNFTFAVLLEFEYIPFNMIHIFIRTFEFACEQILPMCIKFFFSFKAIISGSKRA